MGIYEAPGESDEWYTPKYVFDALGCKFDLDVASPHDGPRHVPADIFYTEGSLEKKWYGFVWMNPPFGNSKTKMEWLRKFFEHGNGIALLPDRTSSAWWHYAARNSSSILFVDGRIKFEKPDGTTGGSPGTGTCFFAAGEKAKIALRNSGLGFCT